MPEPYVPDSPGVRRFMRERAKAYKHAAERETRAFAAGLEKGAQRPAECAGCARQTCGRLVWSKGQLYLPDAYCGDYKKAASRGGEGC